MHTTKERFSNSLMKLQDLVLSHSNTNKYYTKLN